MAFDLCMSEQVESRGACIQIVVGQNGSGKSVYAQEVLRRWRHGTSLAIDDVCWGKPEPKHIAYYADVWTNSEAIRDVQTFDPRIKLVVADEAPIFLPAGSVKRDQYACVRDALVRGRHMGVSLILCMQIPTKLDRAAWTQAQRHVIFRTSSADLERIEELPGMTKRALEYIPQLPPGYAVVVDQFTGLHYPYIPEWFRK